MGVGCRSERRHDPDPEEVGLVLPRDVESVVLDVVGDPGQDIVDRVVVTPGQVLYPGEVDLGGDLPGRRVDSGVPVREPDVGEDWPVDVLQLVVVCDRGVAVVDHYLSCPLERLGVNEIEVRGPVGHDELCAVPRQPPPLVWVALVPESRALRSRLGTPSRSRDAIELRSFECLDGPGPMTL